jgi:predicted AAA+ superfamily ATPase
MKMADDYLTLGGYPDQVLNPSQEYMTNLLEDILARDLPESIPSKRRIY